MKLRLVLCLIVLFSSGQLFAQQFYLKASGGYGIGVSPDVIQIRNETLINDAVAVSGSSKTFSFGKGIDAVIGAGYYFTPNVSVEMELGYHKSAAVKYSSSIADPDYTDNADVENTAYSFNIIPSVVFHTDLFSLNPYLKIGPIISFAGIDYTIDEFYKQQANNTTSNYHLKSEYRGGITFGISSAIGVKYSVGSNVSLMFEINSKNMTYAPKEGELKEATENGVTILDRLPAKYKKYSFKESMNADETANSGDRIKAEYPFSSLSLMVGVAVGL